jgi:hypothetical protein
MRTDDVSPWLIRGLYLFGFALILTAAIDLMTTVWPLRPGELTWRYGFLGLAAGYMQTPTLGLLFIMGAAALDDSPMILRLGALVCLLTALVLIGVMGMFGLDVLQMRGLRPEEARASVLAGGIFQEIKYFVAWLVFTTLGYGGMKTARALSDRGSSQPRAPGIVSARGAAGSAD